MSVSFCPCLRGAMKATSPEGQAEHVPQVLAAEHRRIGGLEMLAVPGGDKSE